MTRGKRNLIKLTKE